MKGKRIEELLQKIDVKQARAHNAGNGFFRLGQMLEIGNKVKGDFSDGCVNNFL